MKYADGCRTCCNFTYHDGKEAYIHSKIQFSIRDSSLYLVVEDVIIKGTKPLFANSCVEFEVI